MAWIDVVILRRFGCADPRTYLNGPRYDKEIGIAVSNQHDIFWRVMKGNKRMLVKGKQLQRRLVSKLGLRWIIYTTMAQHCCGKARRSGYLQYRYDLTAAFPPTRGRSILLRLPLRRHYRLHSSSRSSDFPFQRRHYFALQLHHRLSQRDNQSRNHCVRSGF